MSTDTQPAALDGALANFRVNDPVEATALLKALMDRSVTIHCNNPSC